MVEKFNKFSILDVNFNLEKIDFKNILNKTNPIIFDTNFLFVTFQFKVDVIYEIEKILGTTFSFFIYQGTILELGNIEKKKDKNKKYLKLIASMLKRYNFKIIKSNLNYIDEQILSNLSKKVLIATNDKILRQKIQNNGCKVLYLRQKSYLQIQ